MKERSTSNINLWTAFAFLVYFHACPSYGFVSGTITSTLGRIVPGAVVTFTDEAYPSRSFTAITDAAGRYLINIATSIKENAPQPFSLEQNYPNPFNPSTIIPFTLHDAGNVRLVIFNIQGQKVRTLVNGFVPSGAHSAVWNGTDDRGRQAGAGVYLYRIQVRNQISTKKMLLLDGGLLSAAGRNTSPKAAAVVRTAKPSAPTIYRVTVLGDSIAAFNERNIVLADDEVHDFTVIGKVFHPTGITMVAIPGGVFQMGDEDGKLSDMFPSLFTVHTVTVSSFRMSEAEITNSQYCAFLNAAFASGDIIAKGDTLITGARGLFKGYVFTNLANTDKLELDLPGSRCWITLADNTFSVVPGKENWPVVFVTWYGAKAFAYSYGWDLPREAEWEYGCRGGKQYMWGTADGTIDTTKAWYCPLELLNWESIPKYRSHPVGVKSYPPNPFGLYDMSGNVWEKINDVFDDYPSEPVTDPTGPESGNSCISRGACFMSPEGVCRAANRSGGDSGSRNKMSLAVGFRVVSR